MSIDEFLMIIDYLTPSLVILAIMIGLALIKVINRNISGLWQERIRMMEDIHSLHERLYELESQNKPPYNNCLNNNKEEN